MAKKPKCVICGNSFKPKNGNQITCSTECSKINRAQKLKEFYQSHRTECIEKDKARRNRAKQEKDNTLSVLAAEARRSGMTYGQYVAMQQAQ